MSGGKRSATHRINAHYPNQTTDSTPTTQIKPTMPPSESSDLKRLSFVASSTAKAFEIATPAAEKIYRRAKSFVPEFAQPEFAKVEEGVSCTISPLAHKASDACDRLLHYADGKVDYIVCTADRGKKVFHDVHVANLKSFHAAVAAYMNWVLRTADWVASKILTPTRHRALHDAIAKACEATDPDVAFEMAQDAWKKFSSHWAVAKVLQVADPVTQRGLSTFSSLHDYLVRMYLYKVSVNVGLGTLNYATKTTVYKLGAYYLYPYVAPVADVAISKVSNSQVINSAVDYWRPVVAVKKTA